MDQRTDLFPRPRDIDDVMAIVERLTTRKRPERPKSKWIIRVENTEKLVRALAMTGLITCIVFGLLSKAFGSHPLTETVFFMCFLGISLKNWEEMTSALSTANNFEFIAVDTQEFPHALAVTATEMTDRKSVLKVIDPSQDHLTSVRVVSEQEPSMRDAHFPRFAYAMCKALPTLFQAFSHRSAVRYM